MPSPKPGSEPYTPAGKRRVARKLKPKRAAHTPEQLASIRPSSFPNYRGLHSRRDPRRTYDQFTCALAGETIRHDIYDSAARYHGCYPLPMNNRLSFAVLIDERVSIFYNDEPIAVVSACRRLMAIDLSRMLRRSGYVIRPLNYAFRSMLMDWRIAPVFADRTRTASTGRFEVYRSETLRRAGAMSYATEIPSRGDFICDFTKDAAHCFAIGRAWDLQGFAGILAPSHPLLYQWLRSGNPAMGGLPETLTMQARDELLRRAGAPIPLPASPQKKGGLADDKPASVGDFF